MYLSFDNYSTALDNFYFGYPFSLSNQEYVM